MQNRLEAAPARKSVSQVRNGPRKRCVTVRSCGAGAIGKKKPKTTDQKQGLAQKRWSRATLKGPVQKKKMKSGY